MSKKLFAAAVTVLVLLGVFTVLNVRNSEVSKPLEDPVEGAVIQSQADQAEKASRGVYNRVEAPSPTPQTPSALKQDAPASVAAEVERSDRSELPLPQRPYVQSLPEEHQKAWEAFHARFPNTDPTEGQDYQKALMDKRQEYGFKLSLSESDEYTQWLNLMEPMQFAMVLARAKEEGIPIDGTKPDGSSFSLITFEDGKPIYSYTQNDEAAITTNANLLRFVPDFDPVVGNVIEGEGLYVNINDHGTIYEHDEFQLPGGGSRIVVTEVYDSGNRVHMTHVAGTVAAWGYNPDIQGMAPRVWIRSLIQQSSSDINNYGMQYPGQMHTNVNPTSGEQEMRSVAGNTSLGAFSYDGSYTFSSQTFDQALWDYPYYLHFYAAANSGSNYRTVSEGNTMAKNILVVGNLDDLPRSSEGLALSKGLIISGSSRGPSQDGRVKPDIVANGSSVMSAGGTGNTVRALTGTSMASPNATGSAVLLIDYFNERFPGHFARASTLKALIINTTDDLGRVGPDYTMGWGVMDVYRAAKIIRDFANAPASSTLAEDSIDDGQSWTKTYTHTGDGPIRVTLAWHDLPGTPDTAGDFSARLINDLKLRITGPDNVTHLPFVMPYTTGNGTYAAFDPNLYEALAVMGDNVTDNVEQVLIYAPTAGDYTVEVSHNGNLTGGYQGFSLAVSGLTHTGVLTPQITDISHASDTAVNQLELTVNGSGFIIGTDIFLKQSGQSDVQAYGHIITGDQIVCFVDAASMAHGLWDVVARTPDGTEAVLPASFLIALKQGNNPLGPPVFTSNPVIEATVGSSYTYTANATDADTASSSLSFGATGLPAGLTLADNGNGSATLSGTPTTAGTYTVSLSVTDSRYTILQVFDLVVAPLGGFSAPSITSHPLGKAVSYGGSATLQVVASGENLSYQWYAGTAPDTSNPIAGATSSSYTTPALMSSKDYWVRVSNSGGSVDSYTARVTANSGVNWQRIYVNCSTGNAPYGWNNLPTATSSVADVVNEFGASTGLSITLSNWQGDASLGIFTESVYPADLHESYIYSGPAAGITGLVTISGLTDQQSVNLIALGSRTLDSAGSRNVTYSAGGLSDTHDVGFNYSRMSILNGVQPTDGSVVLSVTESNDVNYAYLNVLQMHLKTNPTPVAPAVHQWPVASSIDAGQSLSSSTLSGGIPGVEGTFDFLTPALIPPSGGTYAAEVVFAPTDSLSYTTLTATVNVQVTGMTAYDTWVDTHGLIGADALRGADPDGDGLINAIEFNLSKNPTVASSLPVLTQDSDPDYLLLTVNTNASSTDTFIIEISSDLQTWQTVETSGTDILVDSASNPMTVRIKKTHLPKYLRLKVTY